MPVNNLFMAIATARKVAADALGGRPARRECKAINESKKGEPHYREVSYGRFERTVALPEGVDADSVKATYHDGVLEITMNAPKTMVPKKVPITVH